MLAARDIPAGTMPVMGGRADPLERMIAGLRDGDTIVFSEFMERFRPALERLASSRIEPRLERRVSAESVAQSVCRTFLRRAGSGRFELTDGDSLWRLLCAMTLTKVRERRRHHGRQKRDLGRERDLDTAPDGALVSATPAPDETVAFAEALQLQLESLTDEERLVFELRLRNLSQAAIADEVDCSERTVRRILQRLEARLRGALEPSGE